MTAAALLRFAAAPVDMLPEVVPHMAKTMSALVVTDPPARVEVLILARGERSYGRAVGELVTQGVVDMVYAAELLAGAADLVRDGDVPVLLAARTVEEHDMAGVITVDRYTPGEPMPSVESRTYTPGDLR